MDNQAQESQFTESFVTTFLNDLPDEQRRHDSEHLCRLMNRITGKPPVLWGSGIIGFDQYHYKYDSGREGDMPAVSFAPRKSKLTVYLLDGLSKYPELLSNLGRHKTGKVCLYIKRLSDVDMTVLEELITASYTYVMSHKHDMHRAS